MKKLLPIGISDYKKIIDKNYYYIDKTLFIDDILKLGRKENMTECADRALEQIKERNYAAQLEQQGVKKIVAFGIALHKKEVLLKQEELNN